MNIKKILISEEEKKDILSMYGVNDSLIDEQVKSPAGIPSYTIQSESYSLENSVVGKDELKIFKGTKFIQKIDGQGKTYLISQAVIAQIVNSLGTNRGSATANVMYGCSTGKFSLANIKNVTLFNEAYKNSQNWYDQEKTLTNQLSKVCQYKVPKQEPVKTDQPKQEPVKKEVEKEVKKVVNKTIKLPDLTNKNYCSLAGDETWSYAKLDDGTWYASKNKVDWFKLDLPKYQKAVDLLNKDAKCLGVTEIPASNAKEPNQIKPSQTNIAPDQDNEEKPV